MCDRITQIQDQINQLADHMCNAIGILQQSAPPSVLPGRQNLTSVPLKAENTEFQPKDLPPLFANLLTRAAKDLDLMIDRLPAADQDTETDVARIKELHQWNQEASQIFQDTVCINQKLLSRIKEALRDIAECEAEVACWNLD